MINIQLDTDSLDLPADLRMQITGSNPAFDKDSVGRVFTYPFRAPASPRNLAALKHLNRMDARRDTNASRRTVSLWIEGYKLEEGDLTITEANDQVIEMAFGKLAGSFLADLEKIKIRQLLPTINIEQTEVGTWVILLNLLSTEFEMTINGVYYTASGVDTDAAGESLRDQINADYPGAASYEDGAYLLTVTALDNGPFNVRLEPSGFPNPGLSLVSHQTVGFAVEKNLHDYVLSVQNSPVEALDFPTLYAPKLYDDKNTPYHGFVNYRYGADVGANSAALTQDFEFAFIPFVKVKYLFDLIIQAVGLEAWSGEVYNDDDFERLLIFNNLTLDLFHEDWNTALNYTEYINSGPRSFALGDHVPDWTALELVKRITAGLNIYMEQRGQTVYLRKRVSQLNGAAVNYNARIGAAYKKIFVEEKPYYLDFQPDPNEKDSVYGQLQPYPAVAGDRVELPFKPLYETTISNSVEETDSWKMCTWLALGTSTPFGLNTNYGFRLFFGRGLQDTTDAETYCMSSTGNTDTAGAVIGTFALPFEGDNGLVEAFFGNWYDLQYANLIEIDAMLDVGELARILRWDNPLVRFLHPEGHVLGMIKTVDCNASLYGIGLAKLTILKL